MKHIISFFVFVMITVMTFSQVPQGFNYQAVVRNDAGEVVTNQQINVKIDILQGGENGTLVWEEEHPVTTNGQGLFTLVIGDPDATYLGGTVSAFGDINWSSGDYFLKVAVDLQGGAGYQEMGSSRLLAVPYAMVAGNVLDKDDADADPTNEIQDLQLDGNILTITRNNAATLIDLSFYLDNTDAQKLSLSGHTLSIENGNAVTINPDDADADPANEIQDLQLEGNILTITRNSGATQIDLSPYLDNPGWKRTGDTLSYCYRECCRGYGYPPGVEAGGAGR